jgi:hypothetical protein
MKILLLTLSLTLSSFAMSGVQHSAGEYQMDKNQVKTENVVTDCVEKNAEIRTEHQHPGKSLLEENSLMFRAVERIVR